MTLPMVLARSAWLHLASFLNKQQSKYTFLSISRPFLRFHVFSTLNQIHPISVTICDTEFECVMEENLSNNTQFLSRMQLYSCKALFKTKMKTQTVQPGKFSSTYSILCSLLQNYIALQYISSKLSQQTEETDAWFPIVLPTYPSCLLTRQSNLASVHPFTRHMPLRSKTDILNAIHRNASPSYKFWSLSKKLFLGITVSSSLSFPILFLSPSLSATVPHSSRTWSKKQHPRLNHTLPRNRGSSWVLCRILCCA